MQLNNPIILKELIQASRHRRMYLIRTLLPALALLLPLPNLLFRMQFVGRDWRMIAEVGKDFFNSCMWLELTTFSLLAFLYAMAAIRDEWSSRTMEVLCASPLSAAGIVYGKFAAVLGRVLLVGLALMPGMAIVIHLARIPWEMGLGCMAILAGSTLWFGTMGLLQAILFSAGRRAGLVWFGILAPYLFVVMLLMALAVPGGPGPLLPAMMPPCALYVVLDGGQAGIGAGWFSLMSLGSLTALSLIGLALAPRLFRRAFERHIGAGAPTRRFSTFKRWMQGRRPKLGDAVNPFYWQERGPATRLLSWAVPIVYLISLPFVLILQTSSGDYEIVAAIFAVVGLIVLFAASAFYGASIFARDKKWGRAQALLLTGRVPSFFLWAKLRATYRALLFSLLLVGAACGCTLAGMSENHNDQNTVGLIMCEALLLGPAAGVIIGMTFSLAASTATLAILGLMSSVLFGIVGYGFMITLIFGFFRIVGTKEPPLLVVTLILAAAVIVASRTRLRRNVWTLGLILATCFWIFLFGTLTAAETHLGQGHDTFLLTLTGSAIIWLIVAFWHRLAIRSFEAGMMEGAKS